MDTPKEQAPDGTPDDLIKTSDESIELSEASLDDISAGAIDSFLKLGTLKSELK